MKLGTAVIGFDIGVIHSFQSISSSPAIAQALVKVETDKQ